MILHKYIKAEYGLAAILESTLKVSLPTKLNDPFEFLPTDVGVWTKTKVKRFLKDKTRRNRIYESQKLQGLVKNKKDFKNALRATDDIALGLVPKFQSKDNWFHIKEMKNQLAENIRLISFSSEFAEDEEEILMWTHYSENHTGFRLHYDSNLLMLPSFELRKIVYSHKRPPIDYTLDNLSNKYINQIITATVTKSMSWEYEKEYRLLVDPKYCFTAKRDSDILYFAKLPVQSLIRVDVGLDCKSNFIEDIKALSKANNFKNITFYKAELYKDKYKINYEKIN